MRHFLPFTVVAVAVIGLGVAGCKDKVTSPAVTLGSLSPDLVCAEQLTTKVVLGGGGFTPMPVNTLSATQLLLPSVQLTLATDLAGAPASGVVLVPDDPQAPASSLVEWHSQQEMAFSVTPALALTPGIYDVTVTNADGRASDTISSGLGVVSRPAIASLDRRSLCSAQSEQTVLLAGTGFLSVGAAAPQVRIGAYSNADFVSVTPGNCRPVSGTFAEGVVSLCTELAVVVPGGLLAPGDYPVTVTNPAPAACASSEAISLHVEPPPQVTSVVPASICQGGGTVTINGQGFLPTAGVSLVPAGGGGAPVGATSVVVNGGGTQITANFGSGSTLGTVYDVVVDNRDGCTSAPPRQQVTVVSGPVTFFADPEVVYNQISTRVTIYVTTLTWPTAGSIDVTMTPSGAAAPRTSLTALPVAGHPNRVQVVIPAGQAEGVYDLNVNDASGCPATLAGAITVTSSTTVALKQVTPPFGDRTTRTAITVLRDTAAGAPRNQPFVSTPRLFLNPVGASGTDVAIQLQSVSFVDADRLTAVVPANAPAGRYDLIAVNPNGSVGLLTDAFNVLSVPPPVVDSVTPVSLLSNATNTLTIRGTNFDAGATAALSCVPGGARLVTLTGAPSCTGGRCSVSGTVGAGLTNGATCVLRLTNSDGSYFDYSAVGVTDTPGNLSSQASGQNLAKGRRALTAAAGNATAAARFVYAVGGDSGPAGAAAPFADVEMASVDLYGAMGAWTPVNRSALAQARAFHGAATVGRYLYVFGGTDGAAPLASTERAMILDPFEAPQLDVSDIVPGAAGLDPGYWIYRVSAVFGAANPDNPGGESLPSDPVILKVPAFMGRKIQVQLSWTAPRDSLGTLIPNVVSYNVYRTPAVNLGSGAEVLIANVPAVASPVWTDDGTAGTASTQKPLPPGSLGKWAQLPSLGTARKGHAATAVFDPSDPTRFYVYAFGGSGASNAMLTSYEYLPVTVQANGRQVAGTAWTSVSNALSAGRWQIGAWVADSTLSGSIPAGTTYIYVGGGLTTGNAFSHAVEACRVDAGGTLTVTSQAPFGSDFAGYSTNAAAGTLFAWGGSGAVPASDGHSAVISSSPPALAAGAWNSVGGINLGSGRYLAGSTVQSAFFFVVGGAAAGGAASNTTLLMVW